MNVKSAFLNVIRQEKVYVEQLKDFTNHDYMYMLKKVIYGLK